MHTDFHECTQTSEIRKLRQQLSSFLVVLIGIIVIFCKIIPVGDLNRCYIRNGVFKVIEKCSKNKEDAYLRDLFIPDLEILEALMSKYVFMLFLCLSLRY